MIATYVYLLKTVGYRFNNGFLFINNSFKKLVWWQHIKQYDLGRLGFLKSMHNFFLKTVVLSDNISISKPLYNGLKRL